MKHRFSDKVTPAMSIVFFGCLTRPPSSQRAAQGERYASRKPRWTAYPSTQTAGAHFQATVASTVRVDFR